MTYVDTEPLAPMMSPENITAAWERRKILMAPDQIRMERIQRLVDGDLSVVLPELSRTEKSSVPNRARQGLQQFAQRIASSLPSVECPPLKPGQDLSEKKARDRRRAILGWWGYNKMGLILRQRARYLQAYASSPVEVSWDLENGVPKYTAMNPLHTYPSRLAGPEDLCPMDVITETQMTLGWVQDNYPLQAMSLAKSKDATRDDLVTVLRYMDEHETQLVAVGTTRVEDPYGNPPPEMLAVRLSWLPNKVGCCPVVFPRMICLSKLLGQYDGIDGMYETEAMLTAMGIQATKRGVFSDMWMVTRPGEEAEIVRDPRPEEGQVGIIKGADPYFHGVDPQFQTNLQVDRLAAAQNETSGLTSELQGQAGTNIRTGARASVLLSNVIDFPIQEAQELLTASLQEENKRAIAWTKCYSGPKSFYVEWEGAQGKVTYDPQSTFDTDQNIVRYPLSGADQAGMVISFGQRVGMKTMSRRTFMKHDPAIPDDEIEHDRVIGEGLEDAVLAALQQQASSDPTALPNTLRIAELVLTDQKELIAAAIQAHEEAQQAQAQQAPPGSPETQPGIAAPPQPGQAPQANQEGLAAMLSGLRRPQTGATPQELAAG